MLLEQGLAVLVGLTLIWLVGLTALFFRQSAHYNKLIGRGTGNLRAILEKILKDREDLEAHIKKVEEALNNLNKKSVGFIQNLGIVRFSPYQETGGNQSFSLALLDSMGTGIVMLSLHGREATRIYVKPVENGKSKYELSKEEQKAIEQATK